MKLLPVRCCCNPAKLLGYLPAPELAIPGECRRFLTGPRLDPLSVRQVDDVGDSYSYVSLPIGVVQHHSAAGERRELAYKSEETPLAVLRRIRGFVEAP